jgi:hypothetical protein
MPIRCQLLDLYEYDHINRLTVFLREPYTELSRRQTTLWPLHMPFRLMPTYCQYGEDRKQKLFMMNGL